MKKWKVTKFNQKVAPYDFDFYFYYGKTMPKIIKQVNKDFKGDLEWDKESSLGLATNAPGRRAFIFLRKGNNKIEEEATLAHEVVHIAIDILDSIGSRVDPKNQEPLTYLVSHLYTICKTFMNDQDRDRERIKKTS